MSQNADSVRSWTARYICCGYDEGVETFASWEEADAFRESYTTGLGVGPTGHQRVVIIKRTAG